MKRLLPSTPLTIMVAVVLIVFFLWLVLSLSRETEPPAVGVPTASMPTHPVAPSTSDSNPALQPAVSDAPADAPPSVGGITADEDALIPAGPPGLVVVSQRDDAHVVQWQGTRDDTILGYQVYRRCLPGEWTKIAFVEIHDGDNRNKGTYVFEDEFDADCEYTVAAVGRDGNPGQMSVDIQ